MMIFKSISQKIIRIGEKLRHDYPRQGFVGTFVVVGVTVFVANIVFSTSLNSKIIALSESDQGLYGLSNDFITVVFGDREQQEKHKIIFQSVATVHEDIDKDQVKIKLSERSLTSKITDWLKDILNKEDKAGIEFSLSETQVSLNGMNIAKSILDSIADNSEGSLSANEIKKVKKEIEEIVNAQNEVFTTTELVEANEVENKEVDEGIDVRYQVLEGVGLKEEIIIKKTISMGEDCFKNTINNGDIENLSEKCSLPKNQFTFTFKLDEGVELRRQITGVNGEPGDIWYLVDKYGRYIAHFEPLFAIDAEGNRINNVELKIKDEKMIVTVDLAWMMDPGRVYPIIIDPSIVHDSLSEFNDGTYNRLESTADPKVRSIYHELPADEHTVGLWHMNETSYDTCSGGQDTCDSSEFGNHGTDTGSTVDTTNEKLGAAARSVSGSSKKVTMPDSDIYDFNTNDDFTIEFWLKDGGGNANQDAIVEKWTYGVAISYSFVFRYNSSDSVSFSRYDLTYNPSASGITPINDGEYHHIAGVKSGDMLFIYIDGELEKTREDTTVASTTNSEPITVGSRNGTSIYDYNGVIDELRISNVARTSEEIKADAQMYSYGVYTSEVLDLGIDIQSIDDLQWSEQGVATGDGETAYSATNLIGDIRFNDTSGTTATDSAGGDQTGTLTNMTGCTASQDGCANSGWTSNNRKWGVGALMFDGNDDYVQYANSSSFNYGTNHFTVEAWIYFDTIDTTRTILRKDDGTWTTAGKQFIIYTDEKLYFDAYATTTVTSAQALRKGEWYHVAVTFNNTSKAIKLYINGKQDGAGTSTLVADNASHVLRSSPNGGILDSLRFYQRELSADEILSNYQAGQIEFQTRTGNDDTPYDGGWEDWSPATSESQIDSMDSQYQYSTSESGLLGYWPMDETADNSCSGGQDVCDISGNGYHGTESGGSKIVDGKYAKARGFDRSDDYISWNGSSHSWLNDDSGSFSAWVKLNDYGTMYPMIMAKSSHTDWNGWDDVILFYVNKNTNKLAYRVFIGNAEVFQADTVKDFPLDEWVHVAITVDTTDGTRIYMNGIEQEMTYATGSQSSHYWFGDVQTTSYETTLGCFRDEASSGVCDYFWDGEIDEVRIYDTNVAASTVMDQYIEGINRTGNSTLSIDPGTSIKVEGTASQRLTTGQPKVEETTAGLWHFEETSGTGAYIKDSSGNGNHATPISTVSDNGISGKARNFDGTTGYIVAPLATTQTQNVTLEAWVYWNGTSQGATLFYNGNAGSNGYGIRIGDGSSGAGNLIQVFLGGITWNVTSSSAVLPTKEWTHIAITRGATTWSLYVDGELQSTGTTSPNTPTDNVSIGASHSGGSKFYGLIDEAAIHNREKTAEEIAEAYRSGRSHYFSTSISSTDFTSKTKMPFWITSDRPGTYLQAIYGESDYGSMFMPDGDVVGLWRFEEDSAYCDSGETGCIRDDSGYGNDGSVVSAPYSTQGKFGLARKFNGTSDYINIGTNESLKPDSFTIEAWVSQNGDQTGKLIFSKYAAIPCEYELGIADSANGSVFFIRSDSTSASYYAYDTISHTSYDGWVYLVGTYDSDERLRLYVNGKLKNVSSSFTRDTSRNDSLNIGRRAYSGAEGYFNGYIDEVRILDIARTPDEIRQSYEIGQRSHNVTIDFGAKLQSGYLIADSSDYSFRVDATIWGADNYGDNIYVGDTIIIRENIDGTYYNAQGKVTSVTVSTGAVTVVSWDAGSTFPSGGYTENATVMKWQKEYVDIREPLSSHKDAVTRINFKLTNGAGGRTIWIDDVGLAGAYLTNPSATDNVTSTDQRYLQYRFILDTYDTDITPYIESVTVNYSSYTSPTNERLMRHGKWFNNASEQGFWWAN